MALKQNPPTSQRTTRPVTCMLRADDPSRTTPNLLLRASHKTAR